MCPIPSGTKGVASLSCEANSSIFGSHPNSRIMYPKGSEFDLVGFLDADYAGDKVDRKSTSGTCHFLGRLLVCWSSKSRTVYLSPLLNLNTLLLDLAALGFCG